MPATPTSVDGYGTVAFDNACSPGVQRELQGAVAALHSFSSSEEQFTAIAKRDPTCAIALWGAAMTARGNPLVGSIDEASLKKGRRYLEAAKRIPTSERDRMLIDALSLYYRDFGSHAARTAAYEAEMEKVGAAFPQDVEIKVISCLSIVEAVDLTDRTYARQKKAGAILAELLPQYPNHPGVAHYLIHAYDFAALAEGALDAARRYASIAPASSHAQHMPAHIFTTLGLWQESIDANRRSIAVYDPNVSARSISSDIEDTHAFDFIAYARLQLAEDTRVRAGLTALRQKGDPQPVNETRYALERQDWKAARALDVAHGSPFDRAIVRFARALGAARLNDAKAARAELDSLRRLRQPVRDEDGDYWAGFVDVFSKSAEAWVAFAEKRKEDALTLMREAADLDDAREKHILLENKILPMREVLGDMLLELNQPAEAFDAYAASLQRAPNRFRSFAGAARAARAAGRREEARSWYEKFNTMSDKADTLRPEIAEARAFLAQ